MKNPLQIYFAQRIKHLFNNLHNFELNEDEVSLHDFRVEMKKLRAVIKFLRSVYPPRNLKKASKKLRSIFQDAGEIREYQLLQQWLLKNDFPFFEKQYFPKEQLLKLNHDFQQRSAGCKQELKEVIEDLGTYIESTNPILAEQYAAELYAQIRKGIEKNKDTSTWHELRKQIKQWMYAINWIPKTKDGTDNELAYFNKLQEAIGLWHDADTIKERLHQKQIFLSRELEVQKEFSRAVQKLNQSLRYREKQVLEMLHKERIPS